MQNNSNHLFFFLSMTNCLLVYIDKFYIINKYSAYLSFLLLIKECNAFSEKGKKNKLVNPYSPFTFRSLSCQHEQNFKL